MNTRANRTVPSEARTIKGRHAVVLGGSLAGLLAARILADRFERVTLIERDAYVDSTAVRKGIPQANHVHGFLQSAPPQRKRGGILFRVEDDRWLVTLIGGGGDYPPSDEQGFLEFADSLPVSIIAEAIRTAEPVAPIRTHRATENRLRHFDGVKNLPDNFLVLGDAACAFNPVYGQGMTTASLGALTLQDCLRDQQKLHPDGSFDGLSRRFQRRLGQVNKAPWLMATGEDYRYREAEGGSPNAMTRFMHWYMDQVLLLATQDVAVRSLLLQVFSMLLPPSALFRRIVLFRVIGQAIRPAGPRDVARKLPRQVLYDVERRYGRETS